MVKNIVLGLIGLIVVVIGLGFVLPDRVEMDREIVINAPQEEVFALISDFDEWNRWSPWAEIDPEAEYTISGEGLGHRMEWVSDDPNVGSGSQEITAYNPPERIAAHLDFGEMGEADAAFTLSAAEGGGTRVVWSFETNMREGAPVHMQPMATYMGFFMDGMLGPQYEQGLANLKREAEAG